MMKTLGFFLLICIGLNSSGQKYPPGKVFRFTSRHSMFPDSLRNVQPRVYNGKTYAAAEHYSDSSVFIFVPDYFNKDRQVNLVFWFHGWNNNIDSALAQFGLLEQFYAAHTNAVFIFPEGPKNAPDSYGGKLEHDGVLSALEVEIFDFLQKKKIWDWRNTSADYLLPPTTSLAGHSGGYRVIGKLLSFNDTYQDVLLFDGLYGEIESYLKLAKSSSRFINIYTDSGGTKKNSTDFLLTLDSLHIPYLHKEEEDLQPADLRNNRVVFLHSKKGHNEVITNNQNFMRFLKKEEAVATPRQ